MLCVEARSKIKLKVFTGVIDRAKLGSLVFGPNNGNNLTRLNGIVWPEIWDLAQQEMERMWEKEDKRVVVLDASVLLAAGWQTKVLKTVQISQHAFIKISNVVEKKSRRMTSDNE